jgi:polyisoprenoid-binding protein YceI
MKTKLLTLAALTTFAGTVIAAPETFDFKDPKGVNNIVFKVDAPLEAASGISGTVTFDPENPAATKGKIVVTTASMTVPNSMQNQHLHSPMWLDAAKYPEITFETKELKNVKTTGDVTTAEAVGTFTLKGISKDLTIPVKLTYLKDKLSQRIPNKQGDLLVIRSTFTIKRSDFNIQAHQNEDKVSDEIELTLSIAGAAAK